MWLLQLQAQFGYSVGQHLLAGLFHLAFVLDSLSLDDTAIMDTQHADIYSLILLVIAEHIHITNG